ncbi:MAG: hypothetical protein K6A38_09315 [Lachnospiraceae bacterium]|nr:hypothetical protein [Lachnospiraceae bacterium]
MKKHSVKDLIKYIPEFAAITVLFAFAVMFMLSYQKEFSENENRVLASCPAPSLDGIFDHSFMDSFEDYISDQFPLRDDLLSFSVIASRAEGKKEVNGVIYAKEGPDNIRLIDRYNKPQNADKFIDAVARLKDGVTSADITVMVVPTSYWLYEDEMPKTTLNTERPLQKDTLKYINDGIDNLGASTKVNMVDNIFDRLTDGRKAGLNIFYRTDHHWTTSGAYMGYLALSPYLMLPERKDLLSNLTCISDSFYGTTWSKVVDRSVKPDTMDIYDSPEWKDHLTVTYENTGESFNSPYNRDYLNVKDKYSVFLNNQHSLITIKNENADLTRTDGEEHRALVVIKDSYANSLIPFLIDHYETIWVFDPRYYRGSITEWINDHPEVKDVLVLYNLSTMDNDRGLGAIY